MFRPPLLTSLYWLIWKSARRRALLHLVVDLYRFAVVGRRFVDREAHSHRFVGIVDRRMRLDVVLDAVKEMLDFGYERVMCDIAGVGLDGGEAPVVERARVVLPRVHPVVLDRALGSEQADVEDVRRLAFDDRGKLAHGAVLEPQRSHDRRVVLVVEVFLGAG